MELFGRSHSVDSVVGLILCTLVVLAAGALAVSASGSTRVAGALYTETNGDHNSVVVFNRYADGRLKQVQSIGTGGRGGHQLQPGCTSHCAILDTQSEVVLSPDGRLLFAVNAGSNTISTFRVTSNRLSLVGQTSSHGAFPQSLAIHGNLLYVLDANGLNIAGFRVSPAGHLTLIKGSRRTLSVGAIAGNPRQVSFDNTGRVLVVTLLAAKSGPVIDTFSVASNGSAGSARANTATTPFPFGFAFDPRNHLIVSQVTSMVGLGSAASYSLTKSHRLHAIDTEGDRGVAPCWVAVTGSGRYAFVVNTGGGAPIGATVSRFRLSPAGKLTLLGSTPNIGELLKTDEALSRDSHFLYVLSPSERSGNTGHIDEYKVGTGGTLTLIGQTPSNLAVGVSGLAAR